MIREHAECGGASHDQLIKLGVDQHLAALNAGLRDSLVIRKEKKQRERERASVR